LNTGSRMDYAKLHAVASMFTVVAYGNIMRLSEKPLLHAAQRQISRPRDKQPALTQPDYKHKQAGYRQPGDRQQHGMHRARGQTGGKQLVD